MNPEISKCYKNSMLFDAQNARNRISELLDFKVFWGEHALRPPLEEKALAAHLVVTAVYYTFKGRL